MTDTAMRPPSRTARSEAGSARARTAPHGFGLDWRAAAGAVVVAVAALFTRLWELRDVPRLTDETDEVMRGLAIAHGEMLPLTNVDAYIGPLWSYLLALGFVVVGPTSWLPRLMTVAVGLVAIAAAGWFGWELGRRLGWTGWPGLVAFGTALLVATSSFHAIVSSRIAWSHALTPLAMTVVLALLLRWDRTGSGRALALAGGAYGLALHTHPTALAFGPGLVIWALTRARSRFRSSPAFMGSHAFMALGLWVLALAPLLVHNALTGFGSAVAAAQVQTAYAGGEAAGLPRYPANLAALLTSLPLLLAGAIGERRGSMAAIDDPIPLVFVALCLIGLASTVRRGLLLPALAIASALLTFPAFNGKYEPLFNGRYLAPMLPLGFALVTVGVAVAADRALRESARARAATVAGLLILTVPPLVGLAGYIAAVTRDGPSNRELYRAVEIVSASRPGRPVLIDATLSGTRASTGRDGVGVLDYLLTLDGRVATRRLQPNDLVAAVERGEGDVVVVSPRLAARLDKDFALTMPAGEAEERQRRRAGFVLLRVRGPG